MIYLDIFTHSLTSQASFPNVLHADQDENKNATTDSKDFLDHCVVVAPLPVQVKRQQLLDLFKQVEGFRKLVMTAPDLGKDFVRGAYVYFESAEACRQAMTKYEDYKVVNLFLFPFPFLSLDCFRF
jgi:hypothetical protein